MKHLKLLFIALLLPSLVLVAGCGGGSSSPASPGPSSLTVTSTGATLTPNAAVQMVFDPGAVTGPTTVTVAAVTPTVAVPQGDGLLPGTAFDFGPTGTQFAKPVHVTITYDPSKLAVGTDLTTLKLYTIKNGAWGQDGITSTTVNAATHTLTADISHFSTYGAMGTVINQFAGTYSGTYRGSGPQGIFGGTVTTLTVNTDGTLTVSADGGAETGTGTVSPTGQTTLTTTGSGSSQGGGAFTFSGAFQITGGIPTASGTFKDSVGDSGSWNISQSSTASAAFNLGGTTWRVSSYSGAAVVPTCPGTATTPEGTVVDCGSDDHTTFNTDGTFISVGIGGTGQNYTTLGTWSQIGNVVTQTFQSETPTDPTNPVQYPVTYSETITVVDSTHFTVPLPPAPGETSTLTAHLTKE